MEVPANYIARAREGPEIINDDDDDGPPMPDSRRVFAPYEEMEETPARLRNTPSSPVSVPGPVPPAPPLPRELEIETSDRRMSGLTSRGMEGDEAEKEEEEEGGGGGNKHSFSSDAATAPLPSDRLTSRPPVARSAAAPPSQGRTRSLVAITSLGRSGRDDHPPDDAPPIPLAQLDLNLRVQEKIRSVLPDQRSIYSGSGIYSSSGNNSAVGAIRTIGNVGREEPRVGAIRVDGVGSVNDDESNEAVYRGNRANRSCQSRSSSQPGTTSSNMIINPSQPDDIEDPEAMTAVVQEAEAGIGRRTPGRTSSASSSQPSTTSSNIIINTSLPDDIEDPEATTAVVQEAEAGMGRRTSGGSTTPVALVVARRVGLFERRWKMLAFGMGSLLLLVVVGLSLTLSGVIKIQDEEEVPTEEAVMANEVTLTPSLSPTHIPGPMLGIVQERGFIRCGLWNHVIKSGEGFHLDLCRSVAAVLFGNPDKFEGVPVNFASRWQNLLDRRVDLVILGDTHTVEREVSESSTGSGFTFSSVFNYDGMVFLGNETFVRCAEEQKRYDECTSLMMCVESATTHFDFLKTAFPSDYFMVGSSLEELTEMLTNGTCNVVAHEKSFLYDYELLNDGIRDGKFVLGTQLKTKEPHAILTRNNDRQFSDIINRVIQMLFYGEEQGLTRDPNKCEEYTHLTLYEVSDLRFLNAIDCVGNYGDIIDGDPDNRGVNQINNGTGMLYAIPFGNLEKDAAVDQTSIDTLAKIRNEGSLKCGIVESDRSEGSIQNMGKDYCRILAAALLNGDPKDVVFVETGSKINSYIELDTGRIDVLIGDGNPRKFDLMRSSQLAGFQFSTPYYYGASSDGGGVSFYSIATREDDALFTSFVNCVVLATIYAQENKIEREKSSEMPLVSVFGSHFNWALRDAIVYSGSYEQVYLRNFGNNDTEAFRGRNTLNKGGPLMLSVPLI